MHQADCHKHVTGKGDLLLNNAWQESWIQSWAYWRAEWRAWLRVAIAASLWMWILLLAVPQVVPFAFMAFQPINDKVVVQTYHRQLTALLHHLPMLVAIGGGLTVIGLLVVPRLFPVKRRALHVVFLGGLSLVFSYAGMAAMRVPLSGPHHPTVDVGIRIASVLLLFLVLVPWTLWRGAAVARGEGRTFWWQIRHEWRETLFLPWTWLLLLVMIQMIAASFAWTTTVNAIGSLLMAVFTVVAGMICESVAYFYHRPSLGPVKLKRTS